MLQYWVKVRPRGDRYGPFDWMTLRRILASALFQGAHIHSVEIVCPRPREELEERRTRRGRRKLEEDAKPS